MKLLVLAVLATCILFASAENYAVLVAGSDGFWNYRHQSDICHAYHLLIERGLLPENIIVFSKDDVATHKDNPFPGQLFNKPTYQEPGVDVRKGCVIDYKGKDVTPANFLAVLRGDKEALIGVGNERVLESTEVDQVFINFSDHGAPDLIAFPNGYLYADDLIKTFDYMFEKKMYHQLSFYLEACESGSMFLNLPTNTSIYALSAADPYQSSYAQYCSPDDVVAGISIGSCLGDEFSVNWMENTDVSDVNQETLLVQFEEVKKLTLGSKVMQWGDLSFDFEFIGDFMGHLDTPKKNTFLNKIEKILHNKRSVTRIDSRDVKMQYLVNKFNKNPTQENSMNLQQEIDLVTRYSAIFKTFQQSMYLRGSKSSNHMDYECYRQVIDQFEDACGRIPESVYRNIKLFAEYCEVPEKGMMTTRYYDISSFTSQYC